MENKLRIIAACPPEYVSSASAKRLAIAHMCYRVCRDGRLYMAEGAEPKGGIMAVDFSEQFQKPAIPYLSEAIIRECLRRSFSGVFLDAPKFSAPDNRAAALAITEKASSIGITVYISSHSYSKSRGLKAVIGTAVSGGTFAGYLSSAVQKYGAENLAIEADLIMSDFILPDRSGKGKSLTKDEFKTLYSGYGKNSFFSKELMAYYFTYHANGKTHFVLYETSQSIRAKLSAANKMGISTAFLYYPDFNGTVF